MSLRCRPRSLLLRRTSSCSALPLNQRRNNDWACNDGAPPTEKLLNMGGGAGTAPKKKEVVNGETTAAAAPVVKKNTLQVPIILEPLREGVEHFSCLETPDPKCHFCKESTNKPVHEDCTRLKIVSRGQQKTGSHKPRFHTENSDAKNPRSFF